MNQYYYIYGLMGLTSSFTFTKNKSRWIIFTEQEKIKFEKNNILPYGITRRGIFINVNKFH